MTAPTLDIHSWRALHSGFVHEVLNSEPEVCLAVNERLLGLDWHAFSQALIDKVIIAQVVPVTRDDAWIRLDYAHEALDYQPVVMMRARLIGADAVKLVKACDDGQGNAITIEEMLGGDE
jgi:hypothetical protein